MGKLITVGSGAPDYDIDPGTYEMTLVGLVETTISSQYGENQPMYKWLFEIPLEDGSVVPVDGLTSQWTGPNSKLYRWLTALVGPVQTGDDFDPADLIGKTCNGQVVANEKGWLAVKEIMAPPRAAAPRRQAAAAPVEEDAPPPRRAAPAARPAQRQTVRAAAGEPELDGDDLPF